MTTFVATWLWTQSCPIIHSQPHVFCVFLEGFVGPRPAVCLLCSVMECMNCLTVTAGLRCNLKPDPVCAGGGARSEVSMMFPWQNPHQFTADPSEIKFGLDSGDTHFDFWAQIGRSSAACQHAADLWEAACSAEAELQTQEIDGHPAHSVRRQKAVPVRVEEAAGTHTPVHTEAIIVEWNIKTRFEKKQPNLVTWNKKPIIL